MVSLRSTWATKQDLISKKLKKYRRNLKPVLLHVYPYFENHFLRLGFLEYCHAFSGVV
jgi:hypothetical protein